MNLTVSDGRPTDPDYKAYLREIAVSYSGCYCRWTHAELRKSYELIVRRFTEWGVHPTISCFRAPDVPYRFGSHYATFIRRRKKIEASMFRDVDWLTLIHSTEPVERHRRGIICEISLNPKWSTFSFRHIPSLLGVQETSVADLFRDLARLSNTQYAWRSRNRVLYTPMPQQWVYDSGYVPFSKQFNYSLYSNRNAWLNRDRPRLNLALHRDVYHRMYLGQTHLNAPIGYQGISLRDWILSDKARGELRPFTDGLMEWAPLSEAIFGLREELYRGGRLFYSKHFLPRNPDARGDDEVRWEPHGEIPEIFNARNFRDCDPELSW